MILLHRVFLLLAKAITVVALSCIFIATPSLVIAGAPSISLPDIKVYKFSSDADPAGLDDLITKQDDYKLDKGVCNDVMNKVWKETNEKWRSQSDGVDLHIALLVHGYPAPTPFENRKYLAKFAYNLQQAGYDDIYAIEYAPDRHINETGEALAQIIFSRCIDFSEKQKIDIFAHSMGGLVARCALEGVLFKDANPHADRRVAHFVTLGTPHNGLTDNSFKVWASQKLIEKKYGGKLLENDDLKKPSDFIKALNGGGGKADCNYYQIGSNDSTKPQEYKSGFESFVLNNQVFVGKVHDGLIVYDSSLFPIDKHCQSVKQKTVGVNHDFLICHKSVFNSLYEWIFNEKWICSYPIKGAILRCWTFRGGKSFIGFPISDEYDVYEGRRQDFEKGSLTWVKNTSTVYMTPNVAPVVAAPVTQLPKIKTNPKDGAEMILIPAGDFLMGSTDADKLADDKEKPQHKVYLDAYYIYKTEVTVAQYRNFCTATGRKMPNAPNWDWQDTNPIVNVTWNDAKAYADWVGAILPTEAQWEKAARGGDGRIYPWGNTWDASKCVNSTNSKNGTKPVGSFPIGASPYGVMDMAGNAWEWCADWYGADYYKKAPAKNPTGPVTGEYRVLRGGSWNYGYYNYCRGAYRLYDGPYDLGNYYGDFGFRCASPGQ
jgi:formylglycine-generating enzyme required for sulfatase activity/triacylglycerol esterase/lipase EstA (alpha/beta hydrolase family)